MVKWWLGIDPGLSGAMVLLDGKGDIEQIMDMPVMPALHGRGQEIEIYGLASLLAGAKALAASKGGEMEVAIERVASMPRQGVASTFKFGVSYGVCMGAAAAISLRLTHVRPNDWKRAMGLLKRPKEASLTKAIMEWPYETQSFSRKTVDVGRADAALIALHAKRVTENVT